MSERVAGASWFQRFLLPGFALKAFIIGGGYATGRELAEYFMGSGPRGGLAGMVLAMAMWSLIAAVTFAFAQMTHAYDYRAFFLRLLGPGWRLFEFAYLVFIVLVLAVFGATAGAIGQAMFGWPSLVGAVLLAVAILFVTSFGEATVERLFKFASITLYGVYAAFLLLSLSSFGDRILAGFETPAPSDGWITGGITYASYNIVGAVVILPVLRHLTSRRDALIAGALAGPLAMLPAILFFICMVGFYPGIGEETLPSDFLLGRLNAPVFHWAFQGMIFIALLESGVGAVHSINERVAGLFEARGRRFGAGPRALLGGALLVGCMFVADRVGLVALIAGGYRLLALLFLIIFVLPVLTLGAARLLRAPAHPSEEATA
ncbi:hypothetical protein B2G71_00090 [Novosphingobium sp. PC22D]|uniref:YkvI family membrane protein n=1 Tax=Novosphingobium sp. PC22D TaxID=1962403 RepID=UPI000BF187A3|nr:hypothetical protein [Novosphingobium sp. PC22D]PEQ14069.1 hypothetical protein B2G71_00090 [Novosphingobium sp. PC22D]